MRRDNVLHSSFCCDNPKLLEHFVDDGEEGGFGHRASLNTLIDRDDLVELFDLLALVEAVEEELYFVFELGRESVSLGARHSRAGAGADRDELFGLRADFFELGFLFFGIDRAFDESDIEFVEDILGLEDARMTDVQDLAPHLEVIVHNLGEDHRAVFATGEGKPADPEFFVRLFRVMLLHSTDMVAYQLEEFQMTNDKPTAGGQNNFQI